MNLLAKLNHAEQLRVRNDIDQGRYDLILVNTDTGRSASAVIGYEDIAFSYSADKIFDLAVDGLIKELRNA